MLIECSSYACTVYLDGDEFTVRCGTEMQMNADVITLLGKKGNNFESLN